MMMLSSAVDAFNDGYGSWQMDTIPDNLLNSIQCHGILVPISCIKTESSLTIIDGFQRFRAAKHLKITHIPYAVVTTDLTPETLIFNLHQSQVCSSAMHKIRFLSALKCTIDSERMSMLGLPYYSHIKKDIDKIDALPESAQLFLHQKGFSLKEMVNLIHHSPEVFLAVLASDPFFNFSKRTLDHVVLSIINLMKRHQSTIQQIFSQTQYTEIINKDITASQRLTQWMACINQCENPTLLAHQNSIHDALNKIELPGKLTFDTTLEHAGITIQTTINSEKELSDFTSALSNRILKQQLLHAVSLT